MYVVIFGDKGLATVSKGPSMKKSSKDSLGQIDDFAFLLVVWFDDDKTKSIRSIILRTRFEDTLLPLQTE